MSIMLDIETLGTKPGCVVLSIGAVEFSEKGLGKQFHVSINPESCTNWGLTVEPRTVMWWMEQSDEARKSLTSRKNNDLDVALDAFIGAYNWKDQAVWCNGANFDFPILEAAFAAVGKHVPWAYWSTNDYRTLKNIVPRDVYNASKVEAQIKHNALADAMAQAETAIQLLSWVNRNVKESKRAA